MVRISPQTALVGVSASCQFFAPSKGAFSGTEARIARTPTRRYAPSKGQQGEHPLARKEFAYVERYHDDHEPCQPVCLRRVPQTALFLCPTPGTGADPAKNGSL